MLKPNLWRLAGLVRDDGHDVVGRLDVGDRVRGRGSHVEDPEGAGQQNKTSFDSE